MKKISVFLLSVFCFSLTNAQKIVKEHYTVTAGALAAFNFDQFRLSGNTPSNAEYNTAIGGAGGLWLNFPVSNVFSIEPQLLYNSYTYKSKTNLSGLLLNDGRIAYASVPLLFKFNLGKNFAVTAGPQFDFFGEVVDRTGNAFQGDFKLAALDVSAGFEIFPKSWGTIFGRYVHGLTDMDDRSMSTGNLKYYNQDIQVGVKIRLFGRKIPADSDGDGIPDPKDKCPDEPGLLRYDGCPIPDTDKDGINDEEDKCPTVPGIAKYNGCPIPDTDKDGINDEEDKCPTVPGVAKYKGCPVPDTDGDGINDENDKCPTVAGLAKYDGCPIPDRDGDGINDEEDKCPDVPGVKEQQGCPAITEEVIQKVNYAAKNVYFNTGSTKLLSKSFAALDDVVSVMNENPSLKLKIDGHTDNVGADDYNMRLSDGRAASVKSYLVSKGISEDRLVSEGFGETTPVADNKTSAGRAKNRRVEITAHY